MEAPAKPKRGPGRPKKKSKEPYRPSDVEGVRAQIQKVLLSNKSPLNLQELACQFLFNCGGVEGFIEKMMIDYRDARPGSPERVRFMEFGAKLIERAVAGQQAREDFDSMSGEDLEKMALELMGKMDIRPFIAWVDHVCI